MGLSKEQLALRRTGLTASDMVTLSRTVPFKMAKTPYDVFMDKVHPEKVKETEVTEAMELGHEVEPVIVARAARKLGLAVLYPTTTVTDPDVPWKICTPDAIVVRAEAAPRPGVIDVEDLRQLYELEASASGLIEAKFVGLHMAPYWEDELPEYVYVQCVWQCHVKRQPFVVVAAMIGTMFKTYRVEYDEGAQELAGALTDVGEKFLVDHVRPGHPPPVDGSESSRRMLAGLFPKNNGVMLKADDGDEEIAAHYFRGKKMVDDGERMKDEAKTAFMAKIQSADGVRGDGWRALWKEQAPYHVDGYDVDAMRKFDLREVGSR